MRALTLKCWNSIITQCIINITLYNWIINYYSNMLWIFFSSYIVALLNVYNVVKISITVKLFFTYSHYFANSKNQKILSYVLTLKFNNLKYIITLRNWIVSKFRLRFFVSSFINLMREYNVFEIIMLLK